jgi:hypothetical protein
MWFDIAHNSVTVREVALDVVMEIVKVAHHENDQAEAKVQHEGISPSELFENRS